MAKVEEEAMAVAGPYLDSKANSWQDKNLNGNSSHPVSGTTHLLIFMKDLVCLQLWITEKLRLLKNKLMEIMALPLLDYTSLYHGISYIVRKYADVFDLWDIR